jgi:hypothetical protein
MPNFQNNMIVVNTLQNLAMSKDVWFDSKEQVRGSVDSKGIVCMGRALSCLHVLASKPRYTETVKVGKKGWKIGL